MEVSHRRGPPPWGLGMKQRGVFVLKAPVCSFPVLTRRLLQSPRDHNVCPRLWLHGEGAAVGAALWEALGY